MTKFDPSLYQIIVQKIEIEGSSYFSGSIRELPDAEVFEDTAHAAYEAMSQLILDLKAAAEEDGRAFPLPMTAAPNVSGRVTLRLPKWLHSRLDQQAQLNMTTLNSHLVTLLTDASARLDTPKVAETFVPCIRTGNVSRTTQAFSSALFREMVIDLEFKAPEVFTWGSSVHHSIPTTRTQTTSVLDAEIPHVVMPKISHLHARRKVAHG